MKKLEKLLNKVADWLRKEGTIAQIVTYAIFILLEVLLFLEGILLHEYILLTLGTYIIVRLVLLDCTEKIFFKRLNKVLIETPKCTAIIFFILAIVTLIISNYSFVAVIMAVIQAVIYENFKNYTKLKAEQSRKLVDENLKENFYKKVYAKYLPWNTEEVANYKIETVNFYAIKEGPNVVIRYPIKPYLIEKNNTVPKKYLTEKNSRIEKSIPKKEFTKYFSLVKWEDK